MLRSRQIRQKPIRLDSDILSSRENSYYNMNSRHIILSNLNYKELGTAAKF